MKEPQANLVDRDTKELAGSKPFSRCTDEELIRIMTLPDDQHLTDDSGIPTTAIGGIRRAIAAGILLYRNSL